MNVYSLSRKARRDVFEVWLYIAKDNIEAANRVEAAIHQNRELLAENPRIGKLAIKATKRPLLSWPAHPYKNYLIFYEVRHSRLTIARVVRGERDLPTLLGS